ncbi:MAG: hypothetical protein NDI61_01935 [Bdellovibrionaceae bacterium]|nr:hypothetical protein [Pseudobdellovibrionaceae bacterium]
MKNVTLKWRHTDDKRIRDFARGFSRKPVITDSNVSHVYKLIGDRLFAIRFCDGCEFELNQFPDYSNCLPWLKMLRETKPQLLIYLAKEAAQIVLKGE